MDDNIKFKHDIDPKQFVQAYLLNDLNLTISNTKKKRIPRMTLIRVNPNTNKAYIGIYYVELKGGDYGIIH